MHFSTAGAIDQPQSTSNRAECKHEENGDEKGKTDLNCYP